MSLFDMEAIFTPDELAALDTFDDLFTAEATEKVDYSYLNRELPRSEAPWDENRLNAEISNQENEASSNSWSDSAFYDDYEDPTAPSESPRAESPYFGNCNEEQPVGNEETCFGEWRDGSVESNCQCTENSGFEQPSYDFTQFLDDDDIELLDSLHPEDWFTKKDEESTNFDFLEGNFQNTASRPKMHIPVRKPHRPATLADLVRRELPPGASLIFWDPSEEPIMLLGSAFDGFSLGKWIHDWAYACHGANSKITELAGDLWLLLIRLVGKIKHSKQTVRTITVKENREMIYDFLESGDRQMSKLKKLLQDCHDPMIKTLQKTDVKLGRKAELGKDAGAEFIKMFFGEHALLERTERFVEGMRLWNLRFDANCEEILSKSSQ